MDRILLALAGLSGLLGVALSAVARHAAGGENLGTAAQFLLFHAPALLGLFVLVQQGLVAPWIGRSAGALIVLGLVLFCGDLSRRALQGVPLFSLAAPTGGFAMMAGWLLVALASLVPARL